MNSDVSVGMAAEHYCECSRRVRCPVEINTSTLYVDEAIRHTTGSICYFNGRIHSSNKDDQPWCLVQQRTIPNRFRNGHARPPSVTWRYSFSNAAVVKQLSDISQHLLAIRLGHSELLVKQLKKTNSSAKKIKSTVDLGNFIIKVLFSSLNAMFTNTAVRRYKWHNTVMSNRYDVKKECVEELENNYMRFIARTLSPCSTCQILLILVQAK